MARIIYARVDEKYLCPICSTTVTRASQSVSFASGFLQTFDFADDKSSSIMPYANIPIWCGWTIDPDLVSGTWKAHNAPVPLAWFWYLLLLFAEYSIINSNKNKKKLIRNLKWHLNDCTIQKWAFVKKKTTENIYIGPKHPLQGGVYRQGLTYYALDTLRWRLTYSLRR